MIANTALEPVFPGSANMNLMDHRYRTGMGERSMLPDGPQKKEPGAQPRNDQRRNDAQQDNQPAPGTSRNGSTMFAAAVIAGSLPPVPQTMDELIRRIGISEIPPESEARLKDIIA